MSARDRRIPGVRFFEAATPGEEAQAIALALRRALDTPEQTAALVTPDRGLARRVAAHLKRWGIAIDDSAGLPLSRTPAGRSEEHTSELPSLMRISYAVFCLKKKTK